MISIFSYLADISLGYMGNDRICTKKLKSLYGNVWGPVEQTFVSHPLECLWRGCTSLVRHSELAVTRWLNTSWTQAMMWIQRGTVHKLMYLGSIYTAVSWCSSLICYLLPVDLFDPLLTSTFKRDSNPISVFISCEHCSSFSSAPFCSITFTDGIKLPPDRFKIYPLFRKAENDQCFAQKTCI